MNDIQIAPLIAVIYIYVICAYVGLRVIEIVLSGTLQDFYNYAVVVKLLAGFKKQSGTDSSIAVNIIGLHVDSFCPIRLAPNFAFGSAEPTVSNCNLANDENV
jgi:hypothetical protein